MKILDILNEDGIDYTKPGPITQSSLGQKLEYGVPVNDKGQFYNPNKIPNYEQLTDAEYSAMVTAYKTWLKDYLTRWPEATQQPDGTWRGLKPFGSTPIKFETYNHGHADPHAPQLGSHEKRDFKRAELQHELGDEDNGTYSVWTQGSKDPKPKSIVTKQCSMDDAERHARNIKKKYPYLKVWVQAHHLGKRGFFPINETASAPANMTTAASVGVGPVYKNKPPKQPKNKDGTAKNALDIDANLMTGGSIKR